MKTSHNTVLDYYFKKLNDIPLLSKEEEREVAKLAKKGDKAAREKLVTANLRFVVKMAKKYVSKEMPLDDLISEGNMGLLRAVETFDPDRKCHFISYAVHWIKQSILKAVAEKSHAVKLPLGWNNSLSQISRLNSESADLPYLEKIEFLSDQTGLKKSEVEKLLKVAQPKMSLDQEVKSQNDDRMTSVYDFIVSKNWVDPEKSLVIDELKQEVKKIIDDLNPIEQDIILSRYGLGDQKQMTLLELGKRYNLTKERIRQIEKSTLQVLKQRMLGTDALAYLD